MNSEHIKDRLHKAIHRTPRSALVMGELVARIEALEAAKK
jgi:hypothetical protein